MSYGQRKCDNDELLSYFQVEAPIHRPSFFLFFFSLTIKDKTKISLTIKILHLGQDSFTRKARTIFTLKIIVSIFLKLFLILVLHLRQFFIVIIFVKRATEVLGNIYIHNTVCIHSFATQPSDIPFRSMAYDRITYVDNHVNFSASTIDHYIAFKDYFISHKIPGCYFIIEPNKVTLRLF